MPNASEEFAFLPEVATALGAPTKAATRLTLTLPDGRTLSAVCLGDGAPTTTFLHGAGLNAHTWDIVALAISGTTLAIDLAGHGDSSWREDAAYTPANLAADVEYALSQWTQEPQLLVGQSLGGLTAATVGANRPDLVREVIIVDIAPDVSVEAPAQLREFYTSATDFASRAEAVDHAISFGLGGDRAATERGVFLNTRVREDGRVEWKHHFAHLANDLLSGSNRPTANAWAPFEAITAPLTLIRATQGYVSAADAETFQTRIPTARIETLDATHNVQESAPLPLAALINDAASRKEIA